MSVPLPLLFSSIVQLHCVCVCVYACVCDYCFCFVVFIHHPILVPVRPVSWFPTTLVLCRIWRIWTFLLRLPLLSMPMSRHPSSVLARTVGFLRTVSLPSTSLYSCISNCLNSSSSHRCRHKVFQWHQLGSSATWYLRRSSSRAVTASSWVEEIQCWLR